MKLHIKYILTVRCKKTLKDELDKLGLHYSEAEIGELEVSEVVYSEKLNQLKYGLTNAGLEVLDDKLALLIQNVKEVIISAIQKPDELPKINLSVYLSETLHYDYSYLSSLFSEITGTTIERFMINQKIERVKELIVHGKLTLTQISHQLNYSSLSHLSNQFKKVTGLTPSFFKKMNQHKMDVLDTY